MASTQCKISDRQLWIPIIIVLGCFVLSMNLAAAGPEIVVTKADRKIDLQSQAVRISVSLKVENSGDEPTDVFYFVLPKSQALHVSYLKAVGYEGKLKDRVTIDLKVPDKPVSTEGDFSDFSVYLVKLHKSLRKGATASLEVYYALTGVLKPFPTEITQADPQLLLFDDSHYVTSAYRVKAQTTSVKLPNSNVESFTTKAPSKHTDLEIKFGPYADVDPLEYSPLTIHYENNRPFAKVESLEREIEISHWGNIYVTENYRMKHVGAPQKGGFSRLDYQTKPMVSGVASLRGLAARLPPRAHSVYYRDEIGNISTSHLRSDFRKTELELETRYPLLGGWSVSFTLGYSLPLEDFVFQSGDGRRGLNITFGSPFGDVVTDDITVKVVLPEGSHKYQAYVPFPLDVSEEVKYTYLDTVGRPVVVLRKSNVVAEHNVQKFQVLYAFAAHSLLVEPLLLVGAFFFFFAACITYLRLDFTISKSSASYLLKQQQEEILDAVQRLHKLIQKRLSITEKLDASLSQLARTGDVAPAKLARKTAEASLKDSSKELKTILDGLEAIDKPPAVLSKVQALVSKEKERQLQAFQKHQVLVECYEKNLSLKDIDQRIAPIQQRYLSLKKEVKGILSTVE